MCPTSQGSQKDLEIPDSTSACRRATATTLSGVNPERKHSTNLPVAGTSGHRDRGSESRSDSVNSLTESANLANVKDIVVSSFLPTYSVGLEKAPPCGAYNFGGGRLLVTLLHPTSNRLRLFTAKTVRHRLRLFLGTPIGPTSGLRAGVFGLSDLVGHRRPPFSLLL